MISIDISWTLTRVYGPPSIPSHVHPLSYCPVAFFLDYCSIVLCHNWTQLKPLHPVVFRVTFVSVSRAVGFLGTVPTKNIPDTFVGTFADPHPTRIRCASGRRFLVTVVERLYCCSLTLSAVDGGSTQAEVPNKCHFKGTCNPRNKTFSNHIYCITSHNF